MSRHMTVGIDDTARASRNNMSVKHSDVITAYIMEFQFLVLENVRLPERILQRNNFDDRLWADFRDSCLGFLIGVSKIQFSAQLIQALVCQGSVAISPMSCGSTYKATLPDLDCRSMLSSLDCMLGRFRRVIGTQRHWRRGG
ncbi:Hypothetical predicted protein [Olea europaea subsp. europaea]|uniref:Uncharacterized protein n=1 Tax=Olea europaea subsp. europaea TaxID=158383 RepID=A0A8S0QHT5_OLEEU|nr:Hypothetical predicted protein [Olea europaea subsp. europaea]